MDRPHFNEGTEDVFRNAETAARRGDGAAFRRCIDELRHRKHGEDLIGELEELQESLDDRRAPRSVAVRVDSHALDGVVLLTDDECQAHRVELLEHATRSIWLSTYTLKDERKEIRPLLAAKARDRVKIHLIVSPGPLRPDSHSEKVYADLRAAGARVTKVTNHSKCVVVDDEHVIIGSANLQCMIFRDVSLRFKSKALAKSLVDYLSSLAD